MLDFETDFLVDKSFAVFRVSFKFQRRFEVVVPGTLENFCT